MHLASCHSLSEDHPPGKIPLAHAPRLRTLHLSGIQPISPSKSTNQLRVLRFETGCPGTWSTSQIALTVNQFIGIRELSFHGEDGGWFPAESYDADLELLCRNLVNLSLQYKEAEFVIWIFKALRAPSLKTVRLTLPEDSSQAESIADWDPSGATRHENVTELIVEESKVSSGPEVHFMAFLAIRFPNVKHLEFPFGDINMVFMFLVWNDSSEFWRTINSLTLSEEDWYFHNGERYEACLEHLVTFVQTYRTIQSLTIEGPMATDSRLTVQLIQQLNDLVDQVQVGPEDGRSFGTGKPQLKGALEDWE